jgi:hypothetical protein
VVVVGDFLHDGVGRLRLFHYNNVEDEWKQIGDSIHGQKEKEKFGASLAVASEGLEKIKLAVGSPHSTHSLAGRTRLRYCVPKQTWNKACFYNSSHARAKTPIPAFAVFFNHVLN